MSVYAQPLAAGASATVSASEALGVIAKEIGEVSETYFPAGESQGLPRLIHIQDAHANFDAQKNISMLIDHLLASNPSVKTVLVEGAFGRIDTTLLRAVPEGVMKQAGLSRLLKKAMISGPEFFQTVSANRGRVAIRGIEEKESYLGNYRAYLGVQKMKAKVEPELKLIETYLKNISARIYPKELREFDKYRGRFEKNELGLADYLDELMRFAKTGIDWKKMSQIRVLIEMSESKTKDPKALARLERELDPAQVFKELTLLEGEVRNFYLKTDEQKELDSLLAHLKLYRKGLNLELVPEEVLLFKDPAHQIQSEAVRAFVAKLLGKVEWPSGTRLEEAAAQILDFYRWAEIRDLKFYEKIKKDYLGKTGESFLLVTGGYHTRGLGNLFRQNNLSFAVLSPRIEKLDAEAEATLYAAQMAEWKFLGNTLAFLKAFDVGDEANQPVSLQKRAEAARSRLREIYQENWTPQNIELLRTKALESAVSEDGKDLIELVLPEAVTAESLGEGEAPQIRTGTWDHEKYIKPQPFLRKDPSQENTKGMSLGQAEFQYDKNIGADVRAALEKHIQNNSLYLMITAVKVETVKGDTRRITLRGKTVQKVFEVSGMSNKAPPTEYLKKIDEQFKSVPYSNFSPGMGRRSVLGLLALGGAAVAIPTLLKWSAKRPIPTVAPSEAPGKAQDIPLEPAKEMKEKWTAFYSLHAYGLEFDYLRPDLDELFHRLGGRSTEYVVLFESAFLAPSMAHLKEEFEKLIAQDDYLQNPRLRQIVQERVEDKNRKSQEVSNYIRSGERSIRGYHKGEARNTPPQGRFYTSLFDYLARKQEEGYGINIEYETIGVETALYSLRAEYLKNRARQALWEGKEEEYLHDMEESVRAEGASLKLRDERLYADQLPAILQQYPSKHLLMFRGTNHYGSDKMIPPQYAGKAFVASSFDRRMTQKDDIDALTVGPRPMAIRSFSKARPLSSAALQAYLWQDALSEALRGAWPYYTVSRYEWEKAVFPIVLNIPPEMVRDLVRKVARAKAADNMQVAALALEWLRRLKIPEIKPEMIQNLQKTASDLLNHQSVALALKWAEEQARDWQMPQGKSLGQTPDEPTEEAEGVSGRSLGVEDDAILAEAVAVLKAFGSTQKELLPIAERAHAALVRLEEIYQRPLKETDFENMETPFLQMIQSSPERDSLNLFFAEIKTQAGIPSLPEIFTPDEKEKMTKSSRYAAEDAGSHSFPSAQVEQRQYPVPLRPEATYPVISIRINDKDYLIGNSYYLVITLADGRKVYWGGQHNLSYSFFFEHFGLGADDIVRRGGLPWIHIDKHRDDYGIYGLGESYRRSWQDEIRRGVFDLSYGDYMGFLQEIDVVSQFHPIRSELELREFLTKDIQGGVVDLDIDVIKPSFREPAEEEFAAFRPLLVAAMDKADVIFVTNSSERARDEGEYLHIAAPGSVQFNARLIGELAQRSSGASLGAQRQDLLSRLSAIQADKILESPSAVRPRFAMIEIHPSEAAKLINEAVDSISTTRRGPQTLARLVREYRDQVDKLHIERRAAESLIRKYRRLSPANQARFELPAPIENLEMEVAILKRRELSPEALEANIYAFFMTVADRLEPADKSAFAAAVVRMVRIRELKSFIQLFSLSPGDPKLFIQSLSPAEATALRAFLSLGLPRAAAVDIAKRTLEELTLAEYDTQELPIIDPEEGLSAGRSLGSGDGLGDSRLPRFDEGLASCVLDGREMLAGGMTQEMIRNYFRQIGEWKEDPSRLKPPRLPDLWDGKVVGKSLGDASGRELMRRALNDYREALEVDDPAGLIDVRRRLARQLAVLVDDEPGFLSDFSFSRNLEDFDSDTQRREDVLLKAAVIEATLSKVAARFQAIRDQAYGPSNWGVVARAFSHPLSDALEKFRQRNVQAALILVESVLNERSGADLLEGSLRGEWFSAFAHRSEEILIDRAGNYEELLEELVSALRTLPPVLPRNASVTFEHIPLWDSVQEALGRILVAAEMFAKDQSLPGFPRESYKDWYLWEELSQGEFSPQKDFALVNLENLFELVGFYRRQSSSEPFEASLMGYLFSSLDRTLNSSVAPQVRAAIWWGMFALVEALGPTRTERALRAAPLDRLVHLTEIDPGYYRKMAEHYTPRDVFGERSSGSSGREVTGASLGSLAESWIAEKPWESEDRLIVWFAKRPELTPPFLDALLSGISKNPVYDAYRGQEIPAMSAFIEGLGYSPTDPKYQETVERIRLAVFGPQATEIIKREGSSGRSHQAIHQRQAIFYDRYLTLLLFGQDKVLSLLDPAAQVYSYANLSAFTLRDELPLLEKRFPKVRKGGKEAPDSLTSEDEARLDMMAQRAAAAGQNLSIFKPLTAVQQNVQDAFLLLLRDRMWLVQSITEALEKEKMLSSPKKNIYESFSPGLRALVDQRVGEKLLASRKQVETKLASLKLTQEDLTDLKRWLLELQGWYLDLSGQARTVRWASAALPKLPELVSLRKTLLLNEDLFFKTDGLFPELMDMSIKSPLAFNALFVRLAKGASLGEGAADDEARKLRALHGDKSLAALPIEPDVTGLEPTEQVRRRALYLNELLKTIRSISEDIVYTDRGMFSWGGWIGHNIAGDLQPFVNFEILKPSSAKISEFYENLKSSSAVLRDAVQIIENGHFHHRSLGQGTYEHPIPYVATGFYLAQQVLFEGPDAAKHRAIFEAATDRFLKMLPKLYASARIAISEAEKTSGASLGQAARFPDWIVKANKKVQTEILNEIDSPQTVKVQIQGIAKDMSRVAPNDITSILNLLGVMQTEKAIDLTLELSPHANSELLDRDLLKALKAHRKPLAQQIEALSVSQPIKTVKMKTGRSIPLPDLALNTVKIFIRECLASRLAAGTAKHESPIMDELEEIDFSDQGSGPASGQSLGFSYQGEFRLSEGESIETVRQKLYRISEALVRELGRGLDEQKIVLSPAAREEAGRLVKTIASEYLKNAYDATIEAHTGPSESPKISYWLDVTERQIVLKVTDEGRGVEPDLAGKIFREYVESKKEKGEEVRYLGGAGKGLRVVGLRVEGIDGEARFWNQPDQGAVFEAVMPFEGIEKKVSGLSLGKEEGGEDLASQAKEAFSRTTRIIQDFVKKSGAFEKQAVVSPEKVSGHTKTKLVPPTDVKISSALFDELFNGGRSWPALRVEREKIAEVLQGESGDLEQPFLIQYFPEIKKYVLVFPSLMTKEGLLIELSGDLEKDSRTEKEAQVAMNEPFVVLSADKTFANVSLKTAQDLLKDFEKSLLEIYSVTQRSAQLYTGRSLGAEAESDSREIRDGLSRSVGASLGFMEGLEQASWINAEKFSSSSGKSVWRFELTGGPRDGAAVYVTQNGFISDEASSETVSEMIQRIFLRSKTEEIARAIVIIGVLQGASSPEAGQLGRIRLRGNARLNELQGFLKIAESNIASGASLGKVVTPEDIEKHIVLLEGRAAALLPQIVERTRRENTEIPPYDIAVVAKKDPEYADLLFAIERLKEVKEGLRIADDQLSFFPRGTSQHVTAKIQKEVWLAKADKLTRFAQGKSLGADIVVGIDKAERIAAQKIPTDAKTDLWHFTLEKGPANGKELYVFANGRLVLIESKDLSDLMKALSLASTGKESDRLAVSALLRAARPDDEGKVRLEIQSGGTMSALRTFLTNAAMSRGASLGKFDVEILRGDDVIIDQELQARIGQFIGKQVRVASKVIFHLSWKGELKGNEKPLTYDPTTKTIHFYTPKSSPEKAFADLKANFGNSLSQIPGQRIGRRVMLGISAGAVVAGVVVMTLHARGRGIRQGLPQVPEPSKETPGGAKEAVKEFREKWAAVYTFHGTAPDFESTREDWDKAFKELGGKSSKFFFIQEAGHPGLPKQYQERLAAEDYLNDPVLMKVAQVMVKTANQEAKEMENNIRQGKYSVRQYYDDARSSGADGFLVALLGYLADKVESGYDIQIGWETMYPESSLASHRKRFFDNQAAANIAAGRMEEYLIARKRGLEAAVYNATFRDSKFYSDQIPNTLNTHPDRKLIFGRGSAHSGNEMLVPKEFPGILINASSQAKGGAITEYFKTPNLKVRAALLVGKPLETQVERDYLLKDAVYMAIQPYRFRDMPIMKWQQEVLPLIWVLAPDDVRDLFNKLKNAKGMKGDPYLAALTIEWLRRLNSPNVKPEMIAKVMAVTEAVRKAEASRPAVEWAAEEAKAWESQPVVKGKSLGFAVSGASLGKRITPELIQLLYEGEEIRVKNNPPYRMTTEKTLHLPGIASIKVYFNRGNERSLTPVLSLLVPEDDSSGYLTLDYLFFSNVYFGNDPISVDLTQQGYSSEMIRRLSSILPEDFKIHTTVVNVDTKEFLYRALHPVGDALITDEMKDPVGNVVLRPGLKAVDQQTGPDEITVSELFALTPIGKVFVRNGFGDLTLRTYEEKLSGAQALLALWQKPQGLVPRAGQGIGVPDFKVTFTKLATGTSLGEEVRYPKDKMSYDVHLDDQWKINAESRKEIPQSALEAVQPLISSEGKIQSHHGMSLAYTIDPKLDAYRYLSDLRRDLESDLAETGLLEKVVFTDPASWHLTLVPLPTDPSALPDPKTPWPAEIREQAVAGVSDLFRAIPFEKSQFDLKGVSLFSHVLMVPAYPKTEEDYQRMVRLRDDFRKTQVKPFNEIPPSVRNFHITLAYIYRPMAPSEFQRFVDILKRYRERTETLEIADHELRYSTDMNTFGPVLVSHAQGASLGAETVEMTPARVKRLSPEIQGDNERLKELGFGKRGGPPKKEQESYERWLIEVIPIGLQGKLLPQLLAKEPRETVETYVKTLLRMKEGMIRRLERDGFLPDLDLFDAFRQNSRTLDTSSLTNSLLQYLTAYDQNEIPLRTQSELLSNLVPYDYVQDLMVKFDTERGLAHLAVLHHPKDPDTFLAKALENIPRLMKKFNIERWLAQKAAADHSADPDAFLTKVLENVPRLMQQFGVERGLAQRAAVSNSKDPDAFLEKVLANVPRLMKKFNVEPWLAQHAAVSYRDPDAFLVKVLEDVPRLMRKFDIERGLAQRAAANYSKDPDAFLAKVLENVPRLMQKFGVERGLAQTAAVSHPTDPDTFLEQVRENIPRLMQKFDIERGLAQNAAVNYPTDPDAFLTKILENVPRLMQKFGVERGVAQYVAISNPIDPDAFLTKVTENVPRLMQKFGVEQDLAQTAAVHNPTDPDAFLDKALANIERLMAEYQIERSLAQHAAVKYKDPDAFLARVLENVPRLMQKFDIERSLAQHAAVSYLDPDAFLTKVLENVLHLMQKFGVERGLAQSAAVGYADPEAFLTKVLANVPRLMQKFNIERGLAQTVATNRPLDPDAFLADAISKAERLSEQPGVSRALALRAAIYAPKDPQSFIQREKASGRSLGASTALSTRAGDETQVYRDLIAQSATPAGKDFSVVILNADMLKEKIVADGLLARLNENPKEIIFLMRHGDAFTDAEANQLLLRAKSQIVSQPERLQIIDARIEINPEIGMKKMLEGRALNRLFQVAKSVNPEIAKEQDLLPYVAVLAGSETFEKMIKDHIKVIEYPRASLPQDESQRGMAELKMVIFAGLLSAVKGDLETLAKTLPDVFTKDASGHFSFTDALLTKLAELVASYQASQETAQAA